MTTVLEAPVETYNQELADRKIERGLALQDMFDGLNEGPKSKFVCVWLLMKIADLEGEDFIDSVQTQYDIIDAIREKLTCEEAKGDGPKTEVLERLTDSALTGTYFKLFHQLFIEEKNTKTMLRYNKDLMKNFGTTSARRSFVTSVYAKHG